MARTAKPRLVRVEDGLTWFVAKLAAEKTGLTKPELARRALAGAIRYLPDEYGRPIWFAQTDIDPLWRANNDRLEKLRSKPPRPKTQAQIEKQWAQSPLAKSQPERIERTPEGRRGDKPMLWRMLSKPKMLKDDGGD